MIVVLGVRDFPEFEFSLTIYFNGFWRQRSLVFEMVQSCWFELGHMENQMNAAEVIREGDVDGVPANAVDNLEGSEIRFS